MKFIEQLTLEDLKRAFRNHLKRQLVPNDMHAVEWAKFWRELKQHCSVVERGPS